MVQLYTSPWIPHCKMAVWTSTVILGLLLIVFVFTCICTCLHTNSGMDASNLEIRIASSDNSHNLIFAIDDMYCDENEFLIMLTPTIIII